MKRTIIGAVFAFALSLVSTAAFAATCNPNFTFDQVPNTTQWNTAFACAFPNVGGLLGGPLDLPASTTGSASLNISPGTAPTTPSNGDIWETSTGLFVQVAGVTVGPLVPGLSGLGTGVVTALDQAVNTTGGMASYPVALSTLSGLPVSVSQGGTGQTNFTATLPLIGNGPGNIAQGTKSGTTTEFATVSGAPVNGDCASWSSGNLIDSGVVGCSGITGIVPASHGGAVCANLEEFGGAGNNSTDNLAPMNNLLAAGGTFGVCLNEGSGRYIFSNTVNYTFAASSYIVTIDGAGSESTIFYWPTAASGIILSYSSPQQGLHMKGLTLSTGQAPATGAALQMSAAVPASSFLWNTIDDVEIRGDDGRVSMSWDTGIFIDGVSFVNMNGLYINGHHTAINNNNGSGVIIQGNSGGSFNFGIVYNITKSFFNVLNKGLELGPLWQGIFISDTNFVNGTHGIFQDSGDTGGLDQLYVTNSEFGLEGNGVSIESEINNIGFTNDYFIVASSGNGIFCQLCDGGQVVGNRFQGSNSGSGFVVQAQGSGVGPGFTVTGNGFYNLTFGMDMINGASGTANIQSNAYFGNGLNVNPSASTGGVTVGGSSP